MQEEATVIKAKLLLEIENDRNAIKEQIDRIKVELEAPPTPNDSVRTQEYRYRKLALEYFLQKNEAAAAEIEEFIRVQLENASYSLAHQWRPENKRMFGLGSLAGLAPPTLFDALTYSYRFRNAITRNFDPDRLQEISLRFLSLPSHVYADHIDQIRKYYKDREISDEYYDIAEWYIGQFIIPKLLETDHGSIHITKKGALIEHIIDRFKQHDYISLAFILPPFIEGTFHDICQTLGLKESLNERAALNQLLQTLQKHTNAIGMEYLLFIMPIRRNRIAHGRELYASYREIAVGFMLDLDLLISVATHSSLPLNGLLDIFRAPTPKKVKNIFNLNIKEHYFQLEVQCRTLGHWLNTDEFWSQLDRQLTQTDIDIKETQRFVCKLEYHSSLFGDEEVALQIKERGKTFLRKTLPAARKRLQAKAAEHDRVLELIKAQLGGRD